MDHLAAATSGPGAGLLVVYLALYVVFSLGVWGAYKKASPQGDPAWAAFVPIYNFIVLLKVAGRPVTWAWFLLLVFIPFVGSLALLVVSIIVLNDVSKSFGHGGGFTVGLVLLAPIFWYILWLGQSTYRGPAGPAGICVRRRRLRPVPALGRLPDVRWLSRRLPPGYPPTPPPGPPAPPPGRDQPLPAASPRARAASPGRAAAVRHLPARCHRRSDVPTGVPGGPVRKRCCRPVRPAPSRACPRIASASARADAGSSSTATRAGPAGGVPQVDVERVVGGRMHGMVEVDRGRRSAGTTRPAPLPLPSMVSVVVRYVHM